MKPSVLSTSATRSRWREPGIETLDLLRICALRMRVIMSPIGSFTDIRSSSPTRLHEAGDKPLGAKLAQRDAAELVLAVKGPRAAAQFAAIADAGRRGIARQFGKLQRGGEALFHRKPLVVGNRLELGTAACELLRHLAPPVVLLDRTLLRHTYRSLRFRV